MGKKVTRSLIAEFRSAQGANKHAATYTAWSFAPAEEDDGDAELLYLEPTFDSQMQAAYWLDEAPTVTRMAHNKDWNASDLDGITKLLDGWLRAWSRSAGPWRTLDVCGGNARNWPAYRSFTRVVDVHDLNPAWGSVPTTSRGRLLKCDLVDLLPEMNRRP